MFCESLPLVAYFINQGADLEVSPNYLIPLCFDAVRVGNLEIFDYLVTAGIDIHRVLDLCNHSQLVTHRSLYNIALGCNTWKLGSLQKIAWSWCWFKSPRCDWLVQIDFSNPRTALDMVIIASRPEEGKYHKGYEYLKRFEGKTSAEKLSLECDIIDHLIVLLADEGVAWTVSV